MNAIQQNPKMNLSKLIFPFLGILILSLNVGIGAQDANQTVKEKMVCQKIELIVNGQTYDDGHKCVSPDAICYLVEGLSLSCFPNPNRDNSASSNKPKTN
ncbi:hypothetical protein [Leptospira kmetyi]|uniref:Porin n=1 Tax=Leptospira kmetyi TaxID=408139 RepID=A0ABX4N770_9LEPT|nr:hypothetical protein [Leptospira kmetyi]PJZ27989.1 hypothetical protein CH378_20210 [Leptospira kmetyi]TGK16591.1 hypothetical protein EHO62_12745 [Leptospira kmetyi]TGK34006.1 hypothetical protein EHO66_01190 [Leptospira kmetyi]